MKTYILSLLTISSLGLAAVAGTGADSDKPSISGSDQGGISTQPSRTEHSTPAAKDSGVDKQIPPTVDSGKSGGAPAPGPDVTTGQGGITGPAPAPGTGSSAIAK